MIYFIAGLSCTLLLFVICLFLVVGAKSIFLYVKSKFLPEKQEPMPEKRQTKKSTATKRKIKPKTLKPVRSIEINPDEIDKIYVKNIS